MLSQFLKEVLGLVVVVEPFGVVPFFLALTMGWSQSHRNQLARTASLTMFGVLLLVALLGTNWLKFFGVSLASFMVGGGVLLFLVSIEMLMGSSSKTKTVSLSPEEVAERQTAFGVFPLGIPLLSGPAAISHVLISTAPSSQVQLWMVLVALVLVTGLSYAVLRFAHRIYQVIGDVGTNVIVRVMGLMLAAIAVETIAHGLEQLMPKVFG